MKKSLVIHFLFAFILLVILLINDFDWDKVNRVFFLIFFIVWSVTTLYLWMREQKQSK